MTKRVVVIGGGFAGVGLCKGLEKLHSKQLEVILVTTCDYLDLVWVSPRSMVHPDEANRQCIPLASILKTTKICMGKATAVKGGKVMVGATADGQGEAMELPYEVLAVCTGSRFSHESMTWAQSDAKPSKVGDRIAQLKAKAEEVQAAETVTVVGAGAAGVEMAAEIAVQHTQKPVTLVSSHEVGGVFIPSVQKKLASFFKQQQSVTLKPNTRVEGELPEELKASVVFFCTGTKPCTEFLRGGDLDKALTQNGLITVDPKTCCVTSATAAGRAVFALGDVTSPGHMDPPFKSGFVAMMAGEAAAKNVLHAAVGGKQMTALKGIPPLKRGGIIALGPHAATGQFNSYKLPGFMAKAKAKDLFRDKTAKKLTGSVIR